MCNHILSYLSALEENNNREWYHANKANYQAAQAEFETIIQDLIFSIGQTDHSILHNNPKDLTFKLVRDTRFSKDKSPYNPTFRCHISSAGKLPVPVGYYLHIHPGNRSFLGGGLFTDLFTDATSRIRTYLNHNPEEFFAIIEQPDFQNNFTVKGTALKRVPKEFPADHPAAEYLKYKSWYIEYPIPDILLSDEKAFVTLATEKFLLMKPFNDFLNRALEGFEMPKR